MNSKFDKLPIRLLIVIIAKGMGESVLKALHNQGVTNCSMTLGVGTAKSEALDCLGLDGPEKDIIFCPISTEGSKYIKAALTSESKLKKAGAGIAFTLPVNAISVNAAKEVKRPITDSKKEMNQMDYELIAAVVDKNMEDEIMLAAREAGASGGTVVRGRTATDGSEERLLNISIHAEKEILLIITKGSDKKNIMKAMNDEAKNRNVDITLLSLPVDDVIGID